MLGWAQPKRFQTYCMLESPHNPKALMNFLGWAVSLPLLTSIPTQPKPQSSVILHARLLVEVSTAKIGINRSDRSGQAV